MDLLEFIAWIALGFVPTFMSLLWTEALIERELASKPALQTKCKEVFTDKKPN